MQQRSEMRVRCPIISQPQILGKAGECGVDLMVHHAKSHSCP
jgi:hypothetical protein